MPLQHADDPGPLGLYKMCNVFEAYRGMVSCMVAGDTHALSPLECSCCTATARQMYRGLSKKRGLLWGLNAPMVPWEETLLKACLALSPSLCTLAEHSALGTRGWYVQMGEDLSAAMQSTGKLPLEEISGGGEHRASGSASPGSWSTKATSSSQNRWRRQSQLLAWVVSDAPTLTAPSMLALFRP